MVKHAVSQEQLNRAHNGIKLDACLEHSRANVAVTIAVVFSFGMPIALFAAWVGSCLKTLAVRHVLFFHARVPLWRDGASIYWDLSSLKIAVVFHFFITWAMCAGVDQTEKELNGTAPSVGAYIFPILGLLGSLALLVFASAIAPCVKRCLSRTTSIIAPIDEDNTRHNLMNPWHPSHSRAGKFYNWTDLARRRRYLLNNLRTTIHWLCQASTRLFQHCNFDTTLQWFGPLPCHIYRQGSQCTHPPDQTSQQTYPHCRIHNGWHCQF